MQKIITTHQSPDMDALLSSYLLYVYSERQANMLFVPAGTTNERAWAVVDTGREYDIDRLRFDHHQEGMDRHECAASLVYTFLVEQVNSYYLVYAPLVELVRKGDTGSTDSEVKASYALGLHAQLSARKRAEYSDHDLWKWAVQEFDVLYVLLLAQYEVQEEIEQKLVWQSDDGRVAALQDAETRHSEYLFQQGFELVVWQNTVNTPNGLSYAIGVSRARGLDHPHIGNVLAQSHLANALLEDEWYLHPAGFFAGRGTSKSLRHDPSPLDIIEVAKVFC